MTSGNGEMAKAGQNNGENVDKNGKSFVDDKEKQGVSYSDEVIYQKTEQGTIPQRQSGLDRYWTAVKNGASGTIAKVKEEKIYHKNSFAELEDEEEEWAEAEVKMMIDEEMSNAHSKEGKGRDIKTMNVYAVNDMKHNDIAETLYTYYHSLKIGATRQVYFLLEPEDAKQQLIQLINENKNMKHQWDEKMDNIEIEKEGKARNIRNIHLKEVETMKHEDAAATMYTHMFATNSAVTKEEYYHMEAKKLKVELVKMINTTQKMIFYKKSNEPSWISSG